MAERGWCGACCDIYYVFWTSLENGKVLKSLHIYVSYAYVLQRYWRMALMCSSVWLHRASHPCPQCPGETSWARSRRSCVQRPEHKTIYVLPHRAGSLPLSPHFFFHHLGAILTNIAVQVAVALLPPPPDKCVCVTKKQFWWHIYWLPTLYKHHPFLFREHFCKEGVKITCSWDSLTARICNYFPVSREMLIGVITDIFMFDQERVISFPST